MIVDFATTVVAEGKVRVARASSEQVPPGAILDREGKPTTDPNAFYDGGMLLPFGGHKGYALALVAEMLAARGRPSGRGRDALSAARPDR